MSIRLVHYIRGLRLAEGGVVRFVIDHAEAVARCGAQVSVLSATAPDAPRSWRTADANPRLIELPDLTPRRPHRFALTARKLLSDADVLHLHTPWDPANIVFARAARLAGVPYVLTLHGMLDGWSMAQKSLKKRAYLATIGSRLLRGASAIHATAEAESIQSKRWAQATRWSVIPCVFDSDPYRERPDASEAKHTFPEVFETGEPVVLFLSRVHPGKGVPELIDAVAHLRDRLPVQCVIAGPAEKAFQRELETQAKRAGVAERIRFVGFVGGSLKNSLLAAADAYVLASAHENFGLALAEAMACGTPVITTRNVGPWRELEAAGAWITEPDSQAIDGALENILRDKAAASRSAERARAWILDAWDPRKTALRYLELYDMINNA